MKKIGLLPAGRIAAVFLTVAFVLSGCAQLRDKFVRKPKKEEEAPIRRYQAVREYDVRPSLELYTRRYIFWKSWHREILSVLGDTNHKKKVVSIEQEVSNLMDMRNMLVDEKAEELQKLIDRMTEIERTIKKERVTAGNEVRIRKKLEALGSEIKGDFSYRKMRGYIRSEFKSR